MFEIDFGFEKFLEHGRDFSEIYLEVYYMIEKVARAYPERYM